MSRVLGDAIDPGCVKTPKGRRRRGILFHRPPQFPSGFANSGEDMAPNKNGVLRVLPAQRFDTAKTHTGHRALWRIAMQQSL